eukprot:700741-Amphidinium_carterae.1
MRWMCTHDHHNEELPSELRIDECHQTLKTKIRFASCKLSWTAVRSRVSAQHCESPASQALEPKERRHVLLRKPAQVVPAAAMVSEREIDLTMSQSVISKSIKGEL